MEHIILSFVEFLKNLSYLGTVIALSFEFVPAEIVLPLAGYWVYQGDMNLYFVILAGTVGGTFGPLTLYALGYYGGRPFILRYGKYFFIKEKQLKTSELFFEKYGHAVAFLARFVPGIRTLISIPCGMAKMSVWKFSVYTFFAMLPITSVYVYLGYKMGPHWKDVGKIVSEYTVPTVAVILVLVAAYVFIKFRKNIAGMGLRVKNKKKGT